MSTPRSTYRLQLSRDFTLADAVAILGYLSELGVDAVYLSPLLQATAGSMHGYDVVDHSRVDADRGGESGLRELVGQLARTCDPAGRPMGLVIDIVPNHMGVADAAQNAAWWRLLRDGPDAETAPWFDVDFAAGAGKALLPVLGDDFDASRDLRVVGDELRYYEHRFPLAPGSADQQATPTQIHERQHYRLMNFRLADTEQNYRRFFAVSSLAALRVEDPAVFDETHVQILRWMRDYGVTGLRVDHPDGLTDPDGYLSRLAAAAPGAWITVEKITQPGERLPPWPVAGMTGYDALAEITGVLVEPSTEATMSRLYSELTGDGRDWATHVADGKRLVAGTILRAEIRRIARLTPAIEHAAAALTELAVAFDVYRSYLPLGGDRLDAAVETATTRRPELTAAIQALLPRLSDAGDEVCQRFQHLTSAMMAKGVEDTAFYRYSRLIALNEVGLSPGRFGLGMSDFHAAQQRRLGEAPLGMTTLSTHDTKRGEDVRARLAVLPELAADWADLARTLLELVPVPNRAFGYLLWQTFVATGLIERQRMHDYAEKAMREAAEGTGWIDPDADFERAVHRAVDDAYDRPEISELINGFAVRIAGPGLVNSLSQKLVQLTMPGVPDVYQGSELAEYSLVDPDNRRPVDFTGLASTLAELRERAAGMDPPPLDGSGRAKLWLTWHALRARRDRAEMFTGYRPLLAEGPERDHLLAFDRGGAITVATRLPAGLAMSGGWSDTSLELPAGDYTDVLTGRAHRGTILAARLLERYPVALLLRDQSSGGGR